MRIIAVICVVWSMFLMSCNSSDGSIGQESSRSSLIRYFIDGQDITNKTVDLQLSSGDTLLISTEIEGEDIQNLGVSWGFSLSKGSLQSYPIMTDDQYKMTVQDGQYQITGRPNMSATVNGISMIEGSVTVNVTVN
mgnify:CR=1 FL=1